MPEVWPSTLPQKLLLGAVLESADNLLESQTDVGPPITRRRSTSAPQPLSGAMVINQAQLDVLSFFVDETILGGALPFTFPEQPGSGVMLVKFTKDGLPKKTSLAPGLYRIEMAMFVLP